MQQFDLFTDTQLDIIEQLASDVFSYDNPQQKELRQIMSTVRHIRDNKQFVPVKLKIYEIQALIVLVSSEFHREQKFGYGCTTECILHELYNKLKYADEYLDPPYVLKPNVETFSPVSNVPSIRAGETPNNTPAHNPLSNGVPVAQI